MSVLAYRSYAKENLLVITVKLEQKEKITEAVAYIRFCKGFKTDNGRSYDTKNVIALKFSLLELAALGKAFKFAAKNKGDSTFVKISKSDKMKKVTLNKTFLTVGTEEGFIGIRFTRYEMEAICDDIAQMVRLANEKLWERDEEQERTAGS